MSTQVHGVQRQQHRAIDRGAADDCGRQRRQRAAPVERPEEQRHRQRRHGDLRRIAPGDRHRYHRARRPGGIAHAGGARDQVRDRDADHAEARDQHDVEHDVDGRGHHGDFQQAMGLVAELEGVVEIVGAEAGEEGAQCHPGSEARHRPDILRPDEQLGQGRRDHCGADRRRQQQPQQQGAVSQQLPVHRAKVVALNRAHRQGVGGRADPGADRDDRGLRQLIGRGVEADRVGADQGFEQEPVARERSAAERPHQRHRPAEGEQPARHVGIEPPRPQAQIRNPEQEARREHREEAAGQHRIGAAPSPGRGEAEAEDQQVADEVHPEISHRPELRDLDARRKLEPGIGPAARQRDCDQQPIVLARRTERPGDLGRDQQDQRHQHETGDTEQHEGLHHRGHEARIVGIRLEEPHEAQSMPVEEDAGDQHDDRQAEAVDAVGLRRQQPGQRHAGDEAKPARHHPAQNVDGAVAEHDGSNFFLDRGFSRDGARDFGQVRVEPVLVRERKGESPRWCEIFTLLPASLA